MLGIPPVRSRRRWSVCAPLLATSLVFAVSWIPSPAQAEVAEALPGDPGPELVVTELSASPVVRTASTTPVVLTVHNPTETSAAATGSLRTPAGWDAATLSFTLEPGATTQLRIPLTAPERAAAGRLTPLVRSVGTEASTSSAGTVIAVPAQAQAALDAGDGRGLASGFSALTPKTRLDQDSPAGWSGRPPGIVQQRQGSTSFGDGLGSADAATLRLRTGPGLHTVSVLTGSTERATLAPDLTSGDDTRPGAAVAAGTWQWTDVAVSADAAGIAEVTMSSADDAAWQLNAVTVTAGRPDPAAADPRWTGSWTAPAMGAGTESPYLDGLEDQTVRTIAHLGSGGEQVRIRISNVWADQPLQVAEAAAAFRDSGAGVDPGSVHELTFEGETTVTVPAGADVLSDPIDLPVRAAQELAVSLYLPEQSDTTWHQQALSTQYLADGNQVFDEDGSGFEAVTSSFFVTAVDVRGTEQEGTVVAIGDSITDGVGSTLDADHRYPDYLARRLQREPDGFRYGVVNAGIGGNRLLTDSFGSERFHESALRRFDRDVLGVPGVTAVIALLGTNDLASYGGNPDGSEATLEDFVAAYTSMIERAHAADVKIVGVTIPPGGGPGETEPVRPQVNDWIREEAPFDAVLDAHELLDDPEAPGQMRPDLDSGDRVHPGDAGYALLAKNVPLPPLTGTTAPQVIGTAVPGLIDGAGEVALSATATSPDGATILDYAWDFGDGATASGADVRHTYQPGSYLATVTVTDDTGRTGTDVVDVEVTDPCGGAECSYRPATDDSYVRNGSYSDDNYGSEATLDVKTASAGFTREALLRFELEELAAGERASLRLYSGSNPEIPLEVVRTETDWSQQQVTWRTRPAEVGGTALTFTAEEPGWYDVDVTELARAAAADGGVLSLSLRATATDNGTHSFAAQERSEGAQAPKLVITDQEAS